MIHVASLKLKLKSTQHKTKRNETNMPEGKPRLLGPFLSPLQHQNIKASPPVGTRSDVAPATGEGDGESSADRISSSSSVQYLRRAPARRGGVCHFKHAARIGDFVVCWTLAISFPGLRRDVVAGAHRRRGLDVQVLQGAQEGAQQAGGLALESWHVCFGYFQSWKKQTNNIPMIRAIGQKCWRVCSKSIDDTMTKYGCLTRHVA